ncbi:MAG: hypothetical protein KC776_38310 [Myxococcales bacterium]|nr:hypothetical protein [Myxococcales bacterium]MCB9576272.1 hypothetical protein [Polyangiaceae bacterium]
MPIWRFEPLGSELFPVGESPFRARGLSYTNALDYVQRKTPGGRAACFARLGNGPFRSYFDQLFLAAGDYDAAPLLALFVVAADLEHVPVGRFIEARSRASARIDAETTSRHMLRTASPELMAARLPVAFNRYFEPCQASVSRIGPSGFDGELSNIPVAMSGLYVHSTNGFVSRALELAGAKGVRLEWQQPESDGDSWDVRVERVRFRASWD